MNGCVLHEFGHAGDDFLHALIHTSDFAAFIKAKFLLTSIGIRTYPQAHTTQVSYCIRHLYLTQSHQALPVEVPQIHTLQTQPAERGVEILRDPGKVCGLVIRREEAKLCGEEDLGAFACLFEPVSYRHNDKDSCLRVLDLHEGH